MSDTPNEKATLGKQGITSDVKVGDDIVRTTIRPSGKRNDDGLIFTQVRIHKDLNSPENSRIIAKNEVVLGYGTNFETSSSAVNGREYDMSTLQKDGVTAAHVTTKRQVTGRLESEFYIPIPMLETTQKATVLMNGKRGLEEKKSTIVLGEGGKDDKTWTVIDRHLIENDFAANIMRNKVDEMLDKDEAKGGDARKKLKASGIRVPEQIAKFVSKPEMATWKDLSGGYGDKAPAQNVPDARPAPLKTK